LQRFHFEGGLLRSRRLARFEVLADAQAVNSAVHPPGRNIVPILKPADGKRCVVHA
jgi:hypothetical protein